MSIRDSFNRASFHPRENLSVFAKGVASGYLPLFGYAGSAAFIAQISSDDACGSCCFSGYTWSGNPVSCAAAVEQLA